MDPAALGAFLSGLGALLSSVASIWIAQRRAKNDCDERIEELRESFDRGVRYEEHELEERWSHLSGD